MKSQGKGSPEALHHHFIPDEMQLSRQRPMPSQIETTLLPQPKEKVYKKKE
jgi:hypothetical protein